MEGSFLEQLQPALRAAVEACPFDLHAWIDPSRELPKRPIDVALEKYPTDHADPQRIVSRVRFILNATEFFDLDDLTRPRVQYAVWVRRMQQHAHRHIYFALTHLRCFARACKVETLEGLNLRAYARGELPDIARLENRVWYWLYRYEMGEPFRHNLSAVVAEWNQSPTLRESIDPEHGEPVLRTGSVSQALRRALAIRNSEPGVTLKPIPKRETGGSREANSALFAYWKRAGMDTTRRRRRWNDLPRRVRVEISGDNRWFVADLQPGVPGQKTQVERIRKATEHGLSVTCGGGADCPRLKEWLHRYQSGWTWPRVWDWYRGLPAAECKRICSEHYRAPGSPKAMAQLVRNAQPKERKVGCRSRDRLFHRLKARGHSEARIAEWYNALPVRRRMRICPDRPSPVSIPAVYQSIGRIEDRSNPMAALERCRQRESRLFDQWCEERRAAVSETAGRKDNGAVDRKRWAGAVVNEYLRMAEAERTARFGPYRPAIHGEPRRRLHDTQRVWTAVAAMAHERKLAALAEADAAAETPPAEPAEPAEAESNGNRKRKTGRKADEFTRQRFEFVEGHTELNWREQADEYRRQHPEDGDFPVDRRDGADVLRRIYGYWTAKGKRPARKSPKAGKSAKITA